MLAEPERVRRLNANARLFRDAAKSAGLDVGTSAGFAIVRSSPAVRLSRAGWPMRCSAEASTSSLFCIRRCPSVRPGCAFFLSSEHSEEQIRATVAAVAQESAAIEASKVDLPALVRRLEASGKLR